MLIKDLFELHAPRLLEAKVESRNFISFLYGHSSMKSKFKQAIIDDLSMLEDLFDFAYLEDSTVDAIAGELVANGKLPTLMQAEREAAKRAKWAIDNMEGKKVWKASFTPVAQEWAKSIAPAVVQSATRYLE